MKRGFTLLTLMILICLAGGAWAGSGTDQLRAGSGLLPFAGASFLRTASSMPESTILLWLGAALVILSWVLRNRSAHRIG